MQSAKPEKRPALASVKPVLPGRLLRTLGSVQATAALRETYGGDAQLLGVRRSALREVLEAFCRSFGSDRPVIIVRSPARINLKGVHVEHRRGEVNYVTHCRETIMVVQPRADRQVVAHNVRSDYPETTFDIAEELACGDESDWSHYLDSPPVIDRVKARQGDWGNYIKAAVLRLQFRFPRKLFAGMNMMVGGDIPQSAGLSSSSALVVCSALAAVGLNRLRISRGELAVLCGEGEWYVGTRGGAGDHAAMIMGRRGHISHLRFFPFELLEYVPLPKTHSVVICNSMRQAQKSSNELSAYNKTIAAYGMVLMLMKHKLATEFGFRVMWLDKHIKHLGDFNLNKDRFPDEFLYEVLKRIPLRITRKQLLEQLPHEREALEKTFRTHNDPKDGYRTRAVAMFGLSEIARGAAAAAVIKRADHKLFGQMMYTSHDGDRIVRHTPDGQQPWDNEMTQVTDAYLDGLIRDLQSGSERRRLAASLVMQPGGYRCSSEALDALVDTAAQVKGVYGAGLTGAGFGGCVLVWVKNAAVPALLDAVRKQYYEARKLPFAAEVCYPVSGAGVLEW